MRREICRRTSTAMTQLNSCHEKDPGQSLIGKLRCVRYSIYMTSVIARECKVGSDVTEKGTQLGLDTVCGGPHSGLLPHNTSHRRAVWS